MCPRGVPSWVKNFLVERNGTFRWKNIKKVTETQISALIRIKYVKSNEKLGVYGSAVAENISCMSDKPYKKTWHHKSSKEGNLRKVAT